MRIILVFMLWIGQAYVALSQSAEPVPPKGFYVIVGAFAVKENAEKFQQELANEGLDVQRGYIPSRTIHYVYLNMDKRLGPCLDQVKITRQNPRLADAWVRLIDEQPATADRLPAEVQPATPAAAPALAEVKEPQEEARPEPEPEEEPPPEVKIIPASEMTLGNTEVFLSLYNEANDRVVEGKVQVVDTERGKLITEVEGNSYLNLPDPKSNSGRLSLICNAFGYRKVQHELNFKQPLNDSTRVFIDEMGTSLIVKFGLNRYQKGDIQVLYNVFFYNDAAVFLPESRFELNELLVMMKENPAYRIRLHGHTNGNYHGKIIKVGPSGNFFSVAQDSKTVMGSAKELSESRAQVIKDYLVANGIDAARMEVKAWGGKRPIFDKKGANAKKNIRVEVEVLAQ